MKFFGGRVSVGLAVAIIAASILTGLKALPVEALVFATDKASAAPWTSFLYPFGTNIVSALLLGMGIGSMGSSLEREIGSGKVAIFYTVLTLLAALATTIGASFMNQQAYLAGPWILSAGIMVAYGTRFPRTQLSLMGIATVEARWLAWASVLLTLAAVVPMSVALFATLSLAFPWAFASGKIPFFPYGQPLQQIKRSRTFGRGVQAPRDGYFDDVRKREKEREERERLRKLFEGSIQDDHKDK